MISRDEALNIILDETHMLGTTKEHILKCLNKVLAENIYSKDCLPPFHKSAMDGYAIKSEDTKACTLNNSKKLKVVGSIKAGDYCDKALKHGQAFKIMTGAPLPKGADAVIQIEKVDTDGDSLYVYEEVKSFNNIIKYGEEIMAGELALEKGSLIRPAEIGMLASLGYENISIHRKPIVSLLVTGDELVDINSKLEYGKIRNSNEYSLSALIENAGAEVLSFGVVEDDKEILKNKIKEALSCSDIIITSGGASVGDYDFVEQVIQELGAEIKFNSVAIKPGKPITFAVLNKKLFFSLPGNPLSAITTFEEFVRPVCEKMLGKRELRNEYFKVILADDFKAKEARTKFIYANLKYENGHFYAYKVGSQSSNHLKTLTKANGIIIIPEGNGSVKAGEILSGRFIFK